MGRPKNFSRDEVLDKAMLLFWKQGFADTSLQDLEQATGVNKSGLYSEFRDKDDIFLESLRHYLTGRDTSALTAEPPAWSNIEQFMITCLSAPGGLSGCLAINSMRELAVVPADAREIIVKSQGFLKRHFLRNIAGQKTKTAPDALAELVLTFFIGLCLEQNLPAKKSAATRKAAEAKIKSFIAIARQS